MNPANPASDPKSIFQYRGKAKAPRDTVSLPNGQVVLVRGLTTQEYGRIQNEMRDEDGVVDWEATAPLYVVYGALKPDGSQAFGMEDVGQIVETARAMVQPIVDKVIELTGVSEEAKKRLAKNWQTMTGKDSSTD